MDAEDFAFRRWRRKQRRRVWSARACAVAGLCGLIVATWFVAIAHKERSSRMLGVNGPTTGKVGSLEAAMRAAEATLPPMPPREPYDFARITQWEDRLDWRVRSYRELLQAGVPIALAGTYRDTSVAFAASLSDEAREEWLRRGLLLAAECGVTSAIERYGESIGDRRFGLRLGLSGADLPWCVLEVAFNLSQDANTRLDASQLWDRLATEEYERRCSRLEQEQNDPEWISYSPRPTRRKMPIWMQAE